MAQRPVADTLHDQNFPYISVWFSRAVNESGLSDWSVARLSISTETVHHDLRFTDGRRAKDMLAVQFVSLIDNYLPEGTSPVVFTANDCVLEMPEAIMKGLRVTGQEVRNGVQRVLVTFRFFLGSMNAMFQPNQAPSVLSEVECALSTRTINDIILPALSLAVTEPSKAAEEHPGSHEQLQARWERLAAAQARDRILLRFDFTLRESQRYTRRHPHRKDAVAAQTSQNRGRPERRGVRYRRRLRPIGISTPRGRIRQALSHQNACATLYDRVTYLSRRDPNEKGRPEAAPSSVFIGR